MSNFARRILRRHGAHREPVAPAIVTPWEKEIENHVGVHVGRPIALVRDHDKARVHVDLHIVPPSSRHPYVFVYTTGMSALPMYGERRRAELSMLLPPAWKPQARGVDWIDFMGAIARHPHVVNTAVGLGHIVFSPDVAPFCGVMIGWSTTLPEETREILVGRDTVIDLFTLVPVFFDEAGCRNAHGMNALVEAFAARGVSDIVDESRTSVFASSIPAWRSESRPRA